MIASVMLENWANGFQICGKIGNKYLWECTNCSEDEKCLNCQKKDDWNDTGEER